MRVTIAALLALSQALAACEKIQPAGAEGLSTKKEAATAVREYVAKAKTTEASDRIAKGATMVYEMPRLDLTAAMLPRQSSASTERAPSGNPCDGPGRRFAEGPRAWEGETQSALKFQMNNPHHFRYRVEPSGPGADATLAISASVDLECEGMWSMTSRVVAGAPSGGAGNCSVSLAGAFDVENELE